MLGRSVISGKVGNGLLTSRTTVVSSLVQDPGAVQTSMGSEGCFSAVYVPTCWPSTRLAKDSAVATRAYIVADWRWIDC